SWNYRKEDGGGIILDMFAHWRYLLDHTFGGVTAVHCTGATHIPTRVDEDGRRYTATADDAAYATFVLKAPRGGGDIIVQFNSSWTVRVYRDDLLQIQVDGTPSRHGEGVRGWGRSRAAWPTPQRTSSVIRNRLPKSTGRRPSPTGVTCGRSVSASRRRWTPRSGAWVSIGPKRVS